MQFNSLKFLIFFPVVTILFYAVPKKGRYIWLLAASYFFYMSWNPMYALLMLFSTAVTYLCSMIIKVQRESDLPRGLSVASLVFGIVLNLAVLFTFKYFDFGVDTINTVLSWFKAKQLTNPFNFVLPVGISFYTFQALGYLIDVFRGDTEAEKNPLRYALFVSFFPQLVAGPIERSSRLLTQLRSLSDVRFDYDRVVHGLITMLWGFFMKVMIADRAAVIANTVYDGYLHLDSFELVAGTVAFAIQIYCDFAGYSTIASGCSEIMGIKLMDNFNTPYFSMSVREFWRRWHISLSTWFRDYLYIPLGGSRKGKVRKYLNTFFTFVVSGLWHGADFTFVVWGALHGFYQVIGDLLSPLKRKVEKKFSFKTETFTWKAGKTLVTSLLVGFAWIFFRADTMHQALTVIKRIFTLPNPWALTDGTIFNLGLDRQQINILVLAVCALLVVDLLRRFKNVRIETALDNQNVLARPALVVLLTVIIVIFGAYGYTFNASQFIYFQF